MCNKNTKTRKVRINRKATFVAKSKAKFGEDLLDYSKVKIHNSRTKVTLICKICGYEWKTYQHNHIGKQSSGCPQCAGVAPRTTEQYKAMCIEVHEDLYDYSNTKYKSMNDKVTFKCNRCGQMLTQIAGNHLYNEQGCGDCNISKGEVWIERLLIKRGINFSHNKTVEWSDGLKYDFIIDEPLLGEMLIIEVDGSYHREDNTFFKTTAEEQLLRDKYKDELAAYNGRKVIRLTYDTKDNLLKEFYAKFVNVYLN